MKFLIHLLAVTVLALGILASAEGQSSSKPKYSAPSAPKPAEKPKEQPKEKPKYSAPEKPKEATKEKPQEAPSTSSKPDASKPKSSPNVSEKAREAKEARSERKYEESKAASAPPKPSYKTPDGKEVKIKAESKAVQEIRNKPSASITPQVREQNINVHVTNYHYSHPYNWYSSQPVVYVGGGYSSSFWWMMMEWDAERRARWLYNHQHDIDQEAYRQGMRDAAVAQRIAEMKASHIKPDDEYVDPEFSNDRTMMYDQDFIEASYNPKVVHGDPEGAATVMYVFLALLVVMFTMFILWAVFTQIRFGR